MDATADLLWSAHRADPDHAAGRRGRDRGASPEWASRVAVAQRVSPLLWRVVQEWAADGDEWSAALRDDRRARAGSALAVLLTQAGRLGVSMPQELRRVEAGNTRRFGLDPLLAATWPLEHLDGARRHRLT